MGFRSMFEARGQRSKDKLKTISILNAMIDFLNVAKDTVEILPVKGVLGSASTLIALIRVSQLSINPFHAPLLNNEILKRDRIK